MIYLYARVSTDKQENGREAQVGRLRKWAADNGHEVAGEFVDEDVSAFHVPLANRPAGSKLWLALQPGDTVVITKLDRAFRGLADYAATLDRWRQESITPLLLDMPVNVTTAEGRAMLGSFAVWAQFESELHGQRKREVYDYKRKNALPYNSVRPFGWQVTRDAKGKLQSWVPWEKERELGRRATAMKADGMSLSEIALQFCREGHTKPRGKYYLVMDVLLLLRAAANGYPKLPRAFWQAPDYEQKLCEARASGLPI